MFIFGGGSAQVDIGDTVGYSARFRSSASANMTRTSNASVTNVQKFTISTWVKRGILGAIQCIASAGSGTNNFAIRFNANDTIEIFAPNTGAAIDLVTNAVFRDTSAWYHIVFAVDTTQATPAQRNRFYVNGVEITSFSVATNFTLNATSSIWNSTSTAHYLGVFTNNASGFLDGYIADFINVDGTQLTPTSFGRISQQTGAWVHKNPSGITYGLNGFRLLFNSVSTASDFGTDSSGNGLTFTVNNISATSGETYDWMLDTPTNNYCVWNTNDTPSVNNSRIWGNLRHTALAGTQQWAVGTYILSSGKWYWESKFTTVVSANPGGGIWRQTQSYSGTYLGFNNNGCGVYVDRTYYRNGLLGTLTGTSFSSGDTMNFAFDADNGKLFVGRTPSGSSTITWFNSGDPVAGTGAVFTGLTEGDWTPAVNGTTSVTDTTFGQRPFVASIPTGYKAINTFNMTTPTIIKGSGYFDTLLHTGTGTTQSITGANFQPDLVWIKNRNGTQNNYLQDVVRGITHYLVSNNIGAEDQYSGFGASAVTAVLSNGFSLGTDAIGMSNTNAQTYVDWLWKKGATPGFDIVAYTGTGVNRTVAHGLGAAPAMMIVKDRSNTPNWRVYHKNSNASPASGSLYLNATNAFTADATDWNSTIPTGSVFSVGTGVGTNTNAENYIAYLFAEIAGFSKFGVYTGNGAVSYPNSEGPFIWCGFRPKWIMVKRSNVAGNSWRILDTSRNAYNYANLDLYTDQNAAEDSTPNDAVDFLSNGFKIRTGNAPLNNSGDSYIFAAFAETPFKYSNAR